MKVKPFKGIRPPQKHVAEVSSRPYDVLSSEEARNEAEGNEKSLYHIIKPEIDFDSSVDEHDEMVYGRAVENFRKFREKGWLLQDEKEMYYIYAQTMNGRTQYGWVLCAHVEDYFSGKIKKHELTRKAKEEDRMKHVRVNNANVEPVFFAFPESSELEEIAQKIISQPQEYDFTAGDGIRHQFWLVTKDDNIRSVTAIFSQMQEMYIADGHHRSAAAALVGAEKASQNPQHNGTEEYNYFMAVCFPDKQLSIIDYNRLVKDLNGLSHEEFLRKLETYFEVKKAGSEMVKPQALHHFSIYLDGISYNLKAKPEYINDSDPIDVLDVTISSKYILDEILGIKDLRSDKRIDFVGGIRGLGELKKRVDSEEMRLALALYPVSMQQLMNIADTGNIMPPKTTWFEPKLRSGLVIHELE
ncbi:MAG: DUF1015 domain-containing protein [Bacteroides sp.]